MLPKPAHARSVSPSLRQVLELAAFVRSRSAGVAGVVLGGDFNATPDTLEFSLLQVG